jgi:hypothetical protein
MTTGPLVLLVVVLLLLTGCETWRARTVTRCGPVPRCVDGLPPKALINVTCLPDGICGFSCVPGRWMNGG